MTVLDALLDELQYCTRRYVSAGMTDAYDTEAEFKAKAAETRAAILALARRPVTTSYNPSYAEMRGRCERLEKALRPFAEAAAGYGPDPFRVDYEDGDLAHEHFTVGDLRAAAALLPSDTAGGEHG
jgi:hypothetical protein